MRPGSFAACHTMPSTCVSRRYQDSTACLCSAHTNQFICSTARPSRQAPKGKVSKRLTAWWGARQGGTQKQLVVSWLPGTRRGKATPPGSRHQKWGGGRGCAPMNTTEYTNLLHTWRPWRSSCPPHPVHSCLDLKPSQGKVVRTASRFLPSLRGRGLGTTGATYQTGEGRLPPHAPPVCADSLRHPVCPPAEARAQERLSESLKQSGPGGERGAGRPVRSLQERAS